MSRVGFIGLGNMGGPMCRHVLEAGFEVTAFDLSPDALERVAAAGAWSAMSVAECAAGADVLITMLPGPPQVEQVLLGAQGALARLGPGALAIDMSTSSVPLGRQLLEASRAGGIELLDAPVAGQSIGAEAGMLGIYVGGEEAAVARARPLLEAMGDSDRVLHVGGHGSGYAVKLLLNLLWFMQAVATAEVLTIGTLAGVDLGRLYRALVNSPATSNFLERDVRMVLEDGAYDEAFPMRLVTKDLALAVGLARDVGLPVEMAALVEQIHRRARVEYGDAAGEISAVRLYEDLAGVELRLPSDPG